MMVQDSLLPQDRDLCAWLAKETVDAGSSVIVFCASRMLCETAAKQIFRHAPQPGCS